MGSFCGEVAFFENIELLFENEGFGFYQLCIGIYFYNIFSCRHIFFDFPLEIQFFFISCIVDDLMHRVVFFCILVYKTVCAIFDKCEPIRLFYTDVYVFIALYRYDITVDGAAVIRGIYDFGQGDWEHSYYVRNLTKNRMVWVAVDDESIVQVYVRSELPEEFASEQE